MHWLMHYMPSRETLLANRWIKPFSHRLAHPSLWHFSRRATARGVALGLFLGLLIPVGQMPAAAALAITVRANVVVAVAATFVTNPLTFPAIYFAAYKTGRALLRISADHAALAHSTESMLDFSAFIWELSLPLVLGLLAFAVVASVTGYYTVHILWRSAISRRWRTRRRNLS
jgi:uncharacterized protein